MAKSGIIALGSYSVFSGRVLYTLENPNYTSNTTAATIEIQALSTRVWENSFYGGLYNASVVMKGCTNGNVSVSGWNHFIPMPANTWMTVATFRCSIAHDSYGVANFSLTVKLSTESDDYSNFIIGSITDYSISVPSIYKCAYCSSAPNFGDDQNPTIKITNPYGASDLQACISLDGSKADIAYRPVSVGEYTFNLTDEERNILINAVLTGSSRSVKFIVRCSWYGQYRTSSLQRIFSLTEYEPVLNPVVVDMNSATNALTGDINTFVKYMSEAACNANAEARKNSTISSYSITNGETTKNQAIAAFYNVIDPNFTFSATDSRGNTGTRTITVPMVDYIIPTCEQSTEIELADEQLAKISLTISGQWFNGSFGKVQNEYTLEYRHTDNDGRMGAWRTVPSELLNPSEDNTYTYTQVITGFDYQKTFTFQSRITDKLNTISSSNYAVKLIPVFDWGDEDFNFNVPVKMNEETVLRHNASANNTVLSASGGHIYLRPGGTNSTSGEVVITPQGDIVMNGNSLTTLLSEAGLIVDGATLDYVIQSGTSGGWYYEKYKSGIVKLWGKGSVSKSKDYVMKWSANYPFSLSTVYSATATCNYAAGGNYYDWVASLTTSVEYSNTACNVYCMNTKNVLSTNNSWGVSVHIIGKI